MSHVTIGRWRNNLAVPLPGEIVRDAGLTDGERVYVELRGDNIVIRRAGPRLTLEELFKEKSPDEWRAAYAGAFDWGPDLGREIVEE